MKEGMKNRREENRREGNRKERGEERKRRKRKGGGERRLHYITLQCITYKHTSGYLYENRRTVH